MQWLQMLFPRKRYLQTTNRNLPNSLRLKPFLKRIVSRTKSTLKTYKTSNTWSKPCPQLAVSLRPLRSTEKWTTWCKSNSTSRKNRANIWNATMTERNSLALTTAWDSIKWRNKTVTEIRWRGILLGCLPLDKLKSRTNNRILCMINNSSTTKWCTPSQCKDQWCNRSHPPTRFTWCPI